MNLKDVSKTIAPFKNIMCSISGGSDSDIILDLLSRTDKFKDIHFVYFDTGMEYQATKDHLVYLENKYGITIERVTPKKSIQTVCKEYGQPFVSKQVSGHMANLQRHGFQWEDEPYEILVKRYPKCGAALRWWCNEKGKLYGGCNMFDIAKNKGLKEFIMMNPPDFPISNNCCYFTKKSLSKAYKKQHGIDLSITGMRKAEGGMRANVIKSDFVENEGGVSEYRPIWWFTNEDKLAYDTVFHIKHSDCYSVYGMTRTGCAGCPLARDLEDNLNRIQKYEPKLHNEVLKAFGDSYEYTWKYRDFKRGVRK